MIQVYPIATAVAVGIVVVVAAAAIGEVVVEVGATYGSPGHRGIEAPRRANGSTASLLHHGCMIPRLAIKFSARGAPCSDFLVSSHPFDWIEWAIPVAT